MDIEIESGKSPRSGYKVVGILGIGGEGSVWLCTNQQNQKVAIKIVVADTVAKVNTFYKVAEGLQELIKIWEKGEVFLNGDVCKWVGWIEKKRVNLYIKEINEIVNNIKQGKLPPATIRPPKMSAVVMEYLEGPTLQEFLEQNKEKIVNAITWEEKLYTSVAKVIAIAKILSPLHRKGFHHGDLRPDNIMETNKGFRIFDLCRTPKGLDDIYTDNETLTSPCIQTDIFALGRILETLVTDCKFLEKIPDDLSKILHKACDRKLENRYPTALMSLHELAYWYLDNLLQKETAKGNIGRKKPLEFLEEIMPQLTPEYDVEFTIKIVTT